MDIDSNGNQNGRYSISSLYYDSEEYRCYWEKENGVKNRRKLRIRHYESDSDLTDMTPVFVEIKQRIDRVTQKRRVRLPYIDALRLCNDRQIPDCDPEDQPIIDEVFVLLWQYNLIPASIVSYERQAFMGTIYDAGLRVTFDTTLATQIHPLHLHQKQANLPILPPDRVVMEIKVNERIPHWLTELIAEHNLQINRISKYCRSIEAASNNSYLHRRDLIAKGSEEVLSSAYSVPIFWKRLCECQNNTQVKEK
jgi:SPX domain protein involved in polyphosphate accumulation